MTARSFVDTNILVYAYDAEAGAKGEKARQVVERLWEDAAGIVSTQVLQEFYVTLTHKRAVSRAAARKLLSDFSAWQVQPIGVAEILAACEIEEAHQLSFWDALIVAAARASGAEKLLSEDLSHGQRIEGVLIENPFR